MKINVPAAFVLLAFAVPAVAQLIGGPDRIQTRGPAPGGVPQAVFFAHRLGTDHAEGITTLDMTGNGRKDILSGAYWYENPGPSGGEWKRHQYRTVGTVNEFVADCGEWTVDVNHDGAPDVVTAAWQTNGVWWYENPKKLDAEWKRHFITDSYDTEGGWMADINGDGQPDLILSHYNHSGIIWIDFSGPEPKVHHVGERAQDGHGIGVADIDGDGKADILTTTGWFRQIDADKDQWEWHPRLAPGRHRVPHHRLRRAEQRQDGPHLRPGPQLRALLAGADGGHQWPAPVGPAHHRRVLFAVPRARDGGSSLGDGNMELITGKRYRGHSGHDAGSYDPLVVYYYTINRKTGEFTRFPISVNGTAAVGTQIIAEDLDGDGDIDLATAGKTGVHFFENLRIDRVPKAQREKEILLDRNWPFPGEGPVVTQEEEPEPKK